MSIKAWNIILVLALVIVLAGGGYWLLQAQDEPVAKNQEQAASSQEVEVVKDNFTAPLKKGQMRDQEALLQKIEDTLNGFIGDIDGEIRDYKGRRTVMIDLIKPANLRAPEYIAENYNLAERTNMELQLQMEKVISIFSDANTRMKQLIHQLSSDGEQSQSMQEWQALHDKQLEQYMAFFMKDQEVFQKIQRLLGFYYEHRETIEINVAANSVTFEDAEKQAAAAEMKKEIEALIAGQKPQAQ